MKFLCRLCNNNVTIKKDSRGGLGVLHECGLGPATGVGYTFLDWEVRILGGFEEATRQIFLEEQKDPHCQYVAGERMLSSKFTAFREHQQEWSRETIERLLEEGWPEENTPAEDGLSLEDNESKCVCGDVWPLLNKPTATVTAENTPL